jgi:hypothetical protein
MCKRFLISIVSLLCVTSLVFGTTYPGKVGVGISMGANLPFVDAAKTLRAFENADRTPAATDSQGWPTTDAMTVLWDMRPVAAWFGTIDDPEWHIPDVSGTYKCSFNGQATLSVFQGNFFTANQVYDSATNTTTFDLTVPAGADALNNVVFISFTNTKRTAGSAVNTGFTNLKAIRPGYPIDTAQIFHTPLINAIRSATVGGIGASFSTWRTLGWVSANNTNPPYPQQVEWSQRKLWSDATQDAWGSKLEGGCWESVIWLSNLAHIDPWINIPIHASDDYITQLATLFKNNLDSDRNVYVEWSNEVWNGLFWQAAYNSQMGAAQGLGNIAHYAKRTVEISNIFKNVWGASAINTRVRVMNCWYGEAAFQQQMDYINSHYGPPSQFIYGIASANYLDVRDTGVLDYGTQQEIIDGMWAKSNSWIPYRQTCAAIASSYALPGGHCAYEGGSDTGGGSTSNLPNRIAAERSAGMGDVYLHDLLDNWFPAGGGLYMYLEVTSLYCRYGCWGLTDDVTDPDRNSKFAAVRQILGDPPRPPGKATSPSPGNLATNVPINKGLSWVAGSRATSHDVYFGTSSPGTFRGNQTTTTYNPGTLTYGVTYYWRIDGKNDTGTTTGDVWSFATVAQGVRTMNVIIAVDDGFDLYVNGEYKGSGASWSHAQMYNWIAPLTGENVVAVKAVNTAYGAGMIAELIIDGNRVGTGTTWKVSLSPPAGWQLPGFNDSTWANASDLGAYGGPPWGTGVENMPTNTPAHWIWSSGADPVIYTRYKFTFGSQPPCQATSPSPANGATYVSTAAGLSWAAGTGAASHDVYFGTAGSPPFIGNQTATTYAPGTMTAGTTYYWRINEKNASGTTTGTVWSFTTNPVIASNPSPANGATYVSTTADLSWMAGAGATSHDVYFGTVSSPPFKVNQTATTYDTGTMAGNTTYYWRIDEKNAGGTSVGTVWSFTTLPPPGQATNPSPVNTATAVSTTTGLSWTAGAGATSRDVYFGTVNPPPFVVTQTGTLYDTGTMAYYTTYYWRINEKNAAGTTTGVVWSFTTRSSPPPTPVQLLVWDLVGVTGGSSSAADVFDSNISTTAPSGVASIASGLTPSTSFNGLVAYNLNATTLAEAKANNEYFSWTITPKAGKQMSLKSIELRALNQGAARTFALLSSVDGFVNTIGSVVSGSTDPPLQTINLTGYDYLTSAVEFRLYVYVYPAGSTFETIGIGNMPGNDLIVNGTTASTGPVLPGQATNPTPANGATAVSTTATLSWTAGPGTTSHDVYFGTATIPPFVVNQAGTAYNPGMASSTKYYWRIDEKNATGTMTGVDWSFTTGAATGLPGQAGNPSPANSATGVSITATLSWTAGTGATSHDVYFGTAATPPLIGNQTGTTYTPDLANSVHYYWRIDEKNASGTTTGVVWNFTTIAALPGQATSPIPANSATGVSTTATLSWTAGPRAESHDVYFGTTSPGTFIGNQTTTIYNPVTMANSKTYYWRINEKNATGTTTGVVWSFTTAAAALPDQAFEASPVDGATDVSTTATLSWMPGSGATSHDVYFGTVSSPPLIGNQTATTYNPGTMANSKTYYWRINEKNAVGTTTGVVWSFTTINAPVLPGQATNPSPANAATAVSTTATLSWTADSYATSHDVYFGTVSPGTFIGNQTATTYTPGTMASSKTYYWRINEKNASGTTTGVVWSFTTAAAGGAPGQLLAWDVAGKSGSASATANAFDANISTTAPSGVASIASGLTPGFTSFDGLVAYNLNANTLAEAKTNNEYFSWTITPKSGYQMSVTSIDLRALSQNTSRTFALLSSLDGFVNTIGNVVSASTSPTLQTINVTGHSNLTGAVEFRLYVYPGGNAYETLGIGNMTGNDLIVNGTTAAMGGLPGQASSPSPAIGATGVSTTATLSWTAGSGATSHDVYFGTTSPGTFIGNQAGTTYSPGTMASSKTYYWRIDEKNASGTTTGVVWSFTTIVAAPGQATSPSPANSATGVSTTATLSWTAGSGATSHDVYFGTTSPGTFIGNQAGTTYNPGTMANSKTYYWRIDEKNASGTTTGVVWSFTTAAAALPGQATSPSPANAATGVSTTATLSWTAGSSATSHDVYFGTTSPGTFIGNQAGATYSPGTMANSKTYYWRIDEKNASGTTTGVVWSFTTIVAAPGQATSPNPANAATNVNTAATLSWTAGSGATSHDVYFGSTSSPGDFIGNQTGTTYNPGTMVNNKTYYWRIDEKNAGGTTTGVAWTFTTAAAPVPDQATNPSPANAATNVSTTADLSWTAGSGATSHDVYFGTVSPPPFKVNQTATTYDTGTMANSMTYYWRIDEKNAIGTTTGIVWAFTTAAAGGAPVQLMAWDLAGNNNARTSTADAFNANISTTAPSGVASIALGLTPYNQSFDGLVARDLQATTLAEAKTNNEYFSWTITPKAGYQMSLTSIDLRAMSQNTVRTFTLLSSIDGFASTIGSVTSYSTSPPIQTINVTGHNNLTGAVEFRLYVYSNPAGNTYETLGIGTMTGNDLIVNGTTQ